MTTQPTHADIDAAAQKVRDARAALAPAMARTGETGDAWSAAREAEDAARQAIADAEAELLVLVGARDEDHGEEVVVIGNDTPTDAGLDENVDKAIDS